MKRKDCNKALAVVCVTAMFSGFTAQADDDLEKASKEGVANFQKADSTLKAFIDDAAGYAVFPNVGKGGFVIGAQAGGQTFAEIICFEPPAALDDLKAGRFEMSAVVSAVAAADGVGKAARYKKGVAVFALPKKGLMAQASVAGKSSSSIPSQRAARDLQPRKRRARSRRFARGGSVPRTPRPRT